MSRTGRPDILTLKALADERRLVILELLSDGEERCVCVLGRELGLSDALVSHHVKRLRAAGLVEARREGQWLHVRLAPEALRALAGRLERLAAVGHGGGAARGGDE